MKNALYLIVLCLFTVSCGDDPFKNDPQDFSSDNKSNSSASQTVKSNTNQVTSDNTKLPVMTFDRTNHDFGAIQDGTPQETVFYYTNTGDAPLVISEMKGSCGCTVPKGWSSPLLPNETGQFTVKFNGKGNGKTTNTVTIKANTKKGTERVQISATVNKPGAAINRAPGPIIQ